MGGFFGTIKKESCVTDLFYGVDYNSHLGTKRAGIVTYENGVFKRAIHNIENSYFRSKFEAELPEFSGNSGIGVISDTDAQPIIISCHLGKFAIVTVAKINNVEELEKELLASGNHFSEHSNNIINQSELVSMIISQGKDYVDGIRLVQEKIKGSCSMLLLTEQGIIAARDKYGRSPILVGRGDNGYAIPSETDFSELEKEDDIEVVLQGIVTDDTPLKPDQTEVDTSAPYLVAETMPRFGDSGTLQDFKEWADTRAAAFGGEGRVILSFVVDTVGKVCDINIFQSPDKALSDEAIRIVASSPAWQPATEQGRPVRLRYTLPIDFGKR